MIKIKLNEVPRRFKIHKFDIVDHGKIEMVPDADHTNEFVTFQTKSGKSCDFAATNWGFYLGPSLNSRLKNEGFKSALMVNEQKQIYVVAVEADKTALFEQYLRDNPGSRVVQWLDEWDGNSKI